MSENSRLRIALQKSGRLSEDSFDLLEQAGLRVRVRAVRRFGRGSGVRDGIVPGQHGGRRRVHPEWVVACRALGGVCRYAVRAT